MNEYVIRTENLIRDFTTVRAVDRLSIEIPRGIIVGFLGPNGAGKTTLIRLFLGLLEPTAGEIEVLGLNVRTDAGEIRNRTGALLEHTGLYERLSARDNLDFYSRIWRMSSAARSDRIQELLTHFNLWDRRNEKVGAWSRGMKQKLAVARTMLHNPRLIFFDEPTAGLDPIASVSLRDDIANLVSGNGTTVFLTTHNLTEAEKLCDLIAVISRGKLIAVGHPDELRTKTGKSSVEVKGSDITEQTVSALRSRPEITGVEVTDGLLKLNMTEQANMNDIIRLMIDRGIGIEEIRKNTASLEEAFLKLMEEEV